MGNPAGVKRNFEVLEKRRMQEAQMSKQGIHETEVADRVGVHRQSVNRWARQLKESRYIRFEESRSSGPEAAFD
jgi:transposase